MKQVAYRCGIIISHWNRSDLPSETETDPAASLKVFTCVELGDIYRAALPSSHCCNGNFPAPVQNPGRCIISFFLNRCFLVPHMLADTAGLWKGLQVPWFPTGLSGNQHQLPPDFFSFCLYLRLNCFRSDEYLFFPDTLLIPFVKYCGRKLPDSPYQR